MLRLSMVRLLMALLLASVCASGAAAENEPAASQPSSLADVADQVEAACKASDTKKLATLAAADNPDPWLVADLLEARGKKDEALRFAKAAPRIDVEALPTYLVRDGADAAADARKRLAAVRGLEPDEVVTSLAKGLPTTATVPAVRLHRARGLALHAKGAFKGAAVAHGAAVELATKIGWWAEAADLLYHRGRAFESARDFDSMITVNRARLELETKLESKAGMGRAHFGLGVAHAWQRNAPQMRTHLHRAAQLAQDASDFEYVAKGLAMSAAASSARGHEKSALDASFAASRALESIDCHGLPARLQPDRGRLATGRAQALLTCSSMAYRLNDRPTAEAYAKKAAAVAKDSNDPKLQYFVRGLRALFEGGRLQNAGEHLQALYEFERARDLFARLGDVVQEADARRRIAERRVALGDLAEALKGLEAAQVVLAKARVRTQLLHVHVELARVLVRLGRLRDAGTQLQVVDGLLKHVQDEDAEFQVVAIRAQRASASGAVGRAIELVKAGVLKARSRKFDGVVGTLLVDQARFEGAAGQVDAALVTVGSAIERLEADDNKAALRRARMLRASLLARSGDLEPAYAEFKAQLAEAQEAGNLADTASLLTRMGNVRTVQGRYRDAIPLRRKALGILLALGSEEQGYETRIQLGRDRSFAGDKDDGIDEIQRAYDDMQRDDDEHTPVMSPRLLAWAELALAETHLHAGNYKEAAKYAGLGFKTSTSLGLDLGAGEAAVAGEAWEALPRIGAEACFRLKDFEGVYNFAEAGRAQKLLAAMGGRKALREASVPKELLRKEEAARSAEALAYAQYREARRKGKGLPTLRPLKAVLAKAQSDLSDVVTSIQRSENSQAELVYPGPVKLAVIKEELADDQALVIYTDIAGVKTVAFVITKNENPTILDIGTMAEVEKAVGELLGDHEEPVLPGGVKAARAMLAGKLGLKKNIKHVLISPNAAMAYVPFALMDTTRDMVHVPSGTVFATLREMQVKRIQDKVVGAKVLAMGDPDYRIAGSTERVYKGALTRGARGGQMPQLPETAVEVNSIAKKARGDTVLLAKNATETNFWKELKKRKRWRSIHFACHGLVDPDDATRCSVELTADSENDGSILALDIFNRDVQTDLVVLSGCETGKGRILKGEGVVGLARAFMQAGAPRVIASLWRVNDEATQALMTEFYRLWNPKDRSQAVPTATALRKAQLFVRDHPNGKWKDPRFWAAWMLWGLPD